MKTPTTLRMMVITLGGMLVLLAGVCGYQYLAAAAKGRAIDEQHKKLIVAKQQTATWAQAQADAKVVAATVIQRQAVWNWSEQLPVMVTSLSGMVKDCGIAIDTMQPAHGRVSTSRAFPAAYHDAYRPGQPDQIFSADADGGSTVCHRSGGYSCRKSPGRPITG